MNCPKCHKPLAAADINIQKDIAHCSHCNHVFTISEELKEGEPTIIPDDFDIEAPPKGAWHEIKGDQIIFGATKSSKAAIFLIPFTLVWSGVSLGVIYGHQIVSGEFSILISIFGLPFLAGTVFLVSRIIQSIGGKEEITLDNKGGKIFKGIGKLGSTREFAWDEVVQIIDKPSTIKYANGGNRVISLEGQKRINFGNALKKERRDYLYFVMSHYWDRYQRRKYII